MTKVVMYTTATCAFCRAQKDFLATNNIVFEEKAVDFDSAAQEQMLSDSRELLGGPAMGVPFTVITASDGKRHGVLGFDQPKLKAALSL